MNAGPPGDGETHTTTPATESAATIPAPSPFTRSAEATHRNGWGPFPLPAGVKSPPPKGATGADGRDASRADLQAWLDDRTRHAAANIGVRMPVDVVGLDVDVYAKGDTIKAGDETMRALTADLGLLPRTVVSSSRFETSPDSGIRFFRLPSWAVGQPMANVAGKDVEVIRHGHRYAVAPPSVVEGRTYRLLDQRDPGRVLEVLPPLTDLPELPETWARFLVRDVVPVEPVVGAGAPVSLSEGPPDDRVRRAHSELVGAMSGTAGDRHDLVTMAVAALVGLSAHGHPGVGGVLDAGREQFVKVVGPDRPGGAAVAAAEYDRMVSTAVEKYGTPAVPDWVPDVTWAPPGGWEPAPSQAPEVGSPPDVVAVAASGGGSREVMARAEFARLLARRDAQQMMLAEDREAEPAAPFDMGTLAEVMARPDDPPMRVEGLVPWEASVLLSAMRKTGKTTWALNYARCLLTGDTFLGRFDVVPTSGTVAFLNFEVSAKQLGRWAEDVGVPADRLLLVNLRGRRNPLAHDEDREVLAARLRDAGVEVLIVDPFGRAYGGESQNDAGQVGSWLVGLDTFARSEVGATDLVLTAHAGWEGERTRGSSALEDWADSIVTLTRNPHADEDPRRYMRAMGRDVEVDEDQLIFDPSTRELRLTGSGSRKAAREGRKLDELLARVREVVEAQDPMHLSVADVDRGLAENGVARQKGDTGKACRELVRRGLLKVTEGPRGAKLHALSTHPPRLPPTTPTGGSPTHPDPSIGVGGGGRGAEALTHPGPGAVTR